MPWSPAAKSHARAGRAKVVADAQRAEKRRLKLLYQAEQARLKLEAKTRREHKDLLMAPVNP